MSRMIQMIAVLACCTVAFADRPDVVLTDFEADTYGTWTTTGEAFGTGPAQGTLTNQMPVSGFLGKGLANSYLRGDGTVGTLTSPEFKIERKRINFLIGGGNHPGKACVNLIIGGKQVRTATGRDSEHLLWHSWDVEKWIGLNARIEIIDNVTGGWGHINVDHIIQTDALPENADNRDDLLRRAEGAVQRVAKNIQSDPNRPIFHLLPPANWMNDPNGPIFHNGWWHMFYQHNPYGDNWGNMHWGHFRSKDLAHWEHLPIALWPSKNLGEDHVFSGCATVTKKGQLMLFYTSIGPRMPEQWAAIPEDDDLIRWKKHPANPILTETLHGDKKTHEWRDPFIFRHRDKNYMVLGGNLNASKGGQGIVNVYRPENDDLTEWKYLGVLFQHPDANVKNIECPLFFQIGNRWVLIVSQGKPVHYFVGDLDEKTMTFTPKNRGVMDHGHFYAPNCTQDAKGRWILWGWVDGFPAGKGWRHCLTLPRVLAVDEKDRLVQTPAPELEKLRGKKLAEGNLDLKDASEVWEEVEGDALEMAGEISLKGDAQFGIKFRCAEGKSSATIAWDGRTLDVAGAKVPLRAMREAKPLRVHLFLDKTLLEVYAEGQCVSRVFTSAPDAKSVELFSTGLAEFKSVKCWPIKSVWP